MKSSAAEKGQMKVEMVESGRDSRWCFLAAAVTSTREVQIFVGRLSVCFFVCLIVGKINT